MEGVGVPSWAEEAEEPLHLGAEEVVTPIVQWRRELRVLVLEPEPEHRSTVDT